MKEPHENSIFIMSLDTESIWGYTAYPYHKERALLNMDPSKGRKCIDQLLYLFNEYQVSATWAVVGHLFLDHCERIKGQPHNEIPRFKRDWYSSDPCSDLKKDPLYYGRDIIERILASKIDQEIGYHSFSHVFFSDCSSEVAQAEIEIGIALAKEFGINLKSFVFPENKVGHVDILGKYGFSIYRGANRQRHRANENWPLRYINWCIDKFISEPVSPKLIDGIWEIPSSMLFCDPYFKRSVLPRAKRGLIKAIKSQKVFHIYIHPHDLLRYPSLNTDLEKFLKLVAKMRDYGNIRIMTMGQYANMLNKSMACFPTQGTI